jgi:hypothetical protein
MIAMDIHYSITMSLWRDCWILLMTVPAILSQINEMRPRIVSRLGSGVVCQENQQ